MGIILWLVAWFIILPIINAIKLKNKKNDNILHTGVLIAIIILLIGPFTGFGILLTPLCLIGLAYAVYWFSNRTTIGLYTIEHKGKISKVIDKTNFYICQMAEHPIIIDSSIWMNPQLTSFFTQLLACCQKTNKQIFIPSDVYEEIYNISKSPFIYTYEEKIKNAKLAIDRISNFKNNNLLYIHNLSTHPVCLYNKDNSILSTIQKAQKHGNMFFVLTNDKDLTLRIEQNHDVNQKLCKVISVKPTKYASNIGNGFFKTDLSYYNNTTK